MAFTHAKTVLNGLTKGPTWYSLLLVVTGNNIANRAECSTTPHGSNPTLKAPVNGLQRIIQNPASFVLRGFCGPTDSPVGLGRFVVPVGGRA
jgi:hypothetical protein